MTLGLSHRKELQKRRNQRLWMLIKIILFLSLFIGFGYFAFDTGQKIALRDLEYNKIKFDQQSQNLEKMRIDLGNMEAALNKMQTLLPNKQIEDLLLVINQRVNEGISPDRLAALISGVSKDSKCSDASQSKRFVISTPVSQRTDSSASFYRGLVTVTGKGSPTLDENGNPQAWFDPAKPIAAIFTLPGGEKQEAVGILPLYHSIILQDKEYRFTIISGGRSFADVTVRSCDL